MTISANTTEDPIDANCTGTQGQYTLTLTNAHASFASVVDGDRVFIHQSRGTNVGYKQEATVASYSGGVLTLKEALTFSPQHSATSSVANKAQVRVLKQYTNVTIGSGFTYTAKAWNGLKGGIIGFYLNGTLTGASATSKISAVQCGYIGADIGAIDGNGKQGEGSTGVGNTVANTANGNSGGGGVTQGNDPAGGGGGGGHAVAGGNGGTRYGAGGIGGAAVGSADQSTIFFGGSGGTGGGGSGYASRGGGGSAEIGAATGGGIILIYGKTVDTSSLLLDVQGSQQNRAGGPGVDEGWRGDAASGAILIKCQSATLGTNKCTAPGSIGWVNNVQTGTNNSGTGGSGGSGSEGRITVYYSGSVTGTTNPTATLIQDSSLGASNGYIIRLLVSSNGTNSEIYSTDVTELLEVGQWARWQVSWEDTTSTAKFYRNGILISTQTGSFTSINDNASKFAIACDFNNSGAAQNFFDGLMDDARLWNDVRTASELVTNNDQVLFGTEANLIAYYQFTSNLTDSQTSVNNSLTGTNSPTYSNDVPFSGLTSRNDQDQSLTSGSFVQGYTLGTTIDEGATHRQTFSPAKDPQKSITIDIDTVGTGNWTLTVHDSLNREVASKTISNGELYTGFYEIIFDEVWRPILGATYHFHLTSTVADGVVDTTGASDLETAYFVTHYQFLVEDQYHPMKQMLDFMVIGNERYLAKYEAGNIFDPHRLTFPSGYRVRCLAYWREFIAIGCWKGDEITDFDDGRIFFWDGVSNSYNHSIPVPEGGVNAMFGTQDVLFIVAGYTGEILVYSGGGAAQKFNKIPQLEDGEYVEVAPGSMDMWRSNIHMGVNLNTDSETVHKGVYSIGSSNAAYPPSLGFDYPTSLGDQTVSSVKVSMVFPSGQDLYVGWQNGNAFGIDKVSPTNDPYETGTVEQLISDLGRISREKYTLTARVDFKPLRSGESMRVKYRTDRSSAWKVRKVAGVEFYEDTVGATETVIKIPERSKEIQIAADLKTTTTTSPTLLGITVETEMEESSGKNAD